MNSFEIESQSEAEEHVDKRSPKIDRFRRRLNYYRIHQIDCQVKNEFTSRELCEQESDQIKKLQMQKVVEGKPKRVYKKPVRKIKADQTSAPQKPTVVIASEAQNDLADLNYNEMCALMINDPPKPPFIHPPPLHYDFTQFMHASFLNVYDNPKPSTYTHPY